MSYNLKLLIIILILLALLGLGVYYNPVATMILFITRNEPISFLVKRFIIFIVYCIFMYILFMWIASKGS